MPPAESGQAGGAGAMAVLGRLPLFHGFDQSRIEDLARHCRQLHTGRKQLLFRPGEQAKGLFVVVEGGAKIVRQSPRGHEVVVHLIGPGEIFGGVPLLLDAPYSMAAQTTGRSLVLLVTREPVLRFMTQERQFAERLFRETMARASRALVQALEYARLPTVARVASYLVGHPRQTADEEVWLTASKTSIASLLCISRETLSRCLARLESRGLIRVSGKKVRVLDETALAASCEPGRAGPHKRARGRRGAQAQTIAPADADGYAFAALSSVAETKY